MGVIFSIYIEEVRQFISALTSFEIFPKDVYFLDELPSEIDPMSVIIIFLFSIITTSLASFLPAVAISRMSTIRALKYE